MRKVDLSVILVNWAIHQPSFSIQIEKTTSKLRKVNFSNSCKMSHQPSYNIQTERQTLKLCRVNLGKSTLCATPAPEECCCRNLNTKLHAEQQPPKALLKARHPEWPTYFFPPSSLTNIWSERQTLKLRKSPPTPNRYCCRNPNTTLHADQTTTF